MSVVPHRLHEEGRRKKEGIHWADEVNIDAKRVWDSARVEIKIQTTERNISTKATATLLQTTPPHTTCSGP